MGDLMSYNEGTGVLPCISIGKKIIIKKNKKIVNYILKSKPSIRTNGGRLPRTYEILLKTVFHELSL